MIDNFTEGTDEKSINSKKLCQNQLKNIFYNNQEIFFNMGGDRITSHIQRNKIKINRIEVNEMWRKINGEIQFEPKSMTIYVNDSAFNEMSPSAIKIWKFNGE